ncbi:MAG: helix-turn-helix transcriptional regulator [Planctomycetes bacterium]|nr:helix-turn-helix transcriptional regulator [Planctomycetota bacterium]
MSRRLDNDLFRIGLRIRQVRKQHGLSLDDLARRTDLSKGLLSKIENFRAMPSVPVLAGIARSLNVDMAELVRDVGTDADRPWVLLKAKDRLTVDRDDATGFIHQPLIAHMVGDLMFEALHLTIRPGGERKPVTTEGDEFVLMLGGRIDFIIGDEHVPMSKGDALFFDGRISHVPKNTGNADAKLLAVYMLKHERAS